MADDGSVSRHSHSPHKLIGNHRGRKNQEIPQKQLVKPDKILKVQGNRIAFPVYVNYHNHQFHNPGEQGSIGGPPHAQSRKTKQAENQQGIPDDIDHQGNKISPGGYHHPFHAPHQIEINHGKSHRKIRPGHNAQIGNSCLNHRFLFRKYLHQLAGRKLRSQQKHQSQHHGKAKGNTEYPLNGAHIPLSPILGRQHRSSRCKPEKNQVHNKLHLTGQRCPRQGSLPHLAQHHYIGSGHTHIDQILQRHGNDKGYSHTVKCFGFRCR